MENIGWQKAAVLEQGMQLVDRNGNLTLEVVSQQPTGKLETVYNIKVNEFSTYHIGELGVWVHNADCCDFTKNYGDPRQIFEQGGWINPENGKVRYLDPFDGKLKDFPDGVATSIDHIYPRSRFKAIDSFSDLPKNIQEELINDPINLQPMPKNLNSSKGNTLQDGNGNGKDTGWNQYTKEGKFISQEYRDTLGRMQANVRSVVEEKIKNYNRGNK